MPSGLRGRIGWVGGFPQLGVEAEREVLAPPLQGPLGLSSLT